MWLLHLYSYTKTLNLYIDNLPSIRRFVRSLARLYHFKSPDRYSNYEYAQLIETTTLVTYDL